MKIKILCTLGPASLHPEVIRGLDERGVDLFRINLSHTPVEAIGGIVQMVRQQSSRPICLDTEGAQVRCGMMASGVELRKGHPIGLVAADGLGTDGQITLRPSSTFGTLRVGSLVSIDFDGALLEVTSVNGNSASAVVVEGGRVMSNRAVNVDPPPKLPPLTQKDLDAISCGLDLGIEHFALSFASSAEDVALVRRVTSPGAYVISKIESRAGVRNMGEIIDASDAVLIDRGDLSREVPLQYVPFYQKVIARQANRWNRPVFVATNLLESMVTNRRPTIAEANDIANTLLDGVHGLVLAAETAVGIDPVGAVEMIARSIEAFERSHLSSLLDEDRARPLAAS